MHRLALALAGLFLPLLALWLLARPLGFPPLNANERLSILNLQHLGYENLELLCQATGGEREILVFGASSVQGAQVPITRSFPAKLQARLDARFPGKFSVRNLGRSGKNSFWVKECARAAAAGGAKLWLVYEGHNDFINMVRAGPAKMRWLYEHPAFVGWVDLALRSPFSGWLRPWISTAPPLLNHEQHEAHLRQVLEISEANYRDLIALARERGARLALATVLSNLEIAPSPHPVTGYPDGLDATAAHRAAEQAFAEGRKTEALRLYRLARDRDAFPFRAPSLFNELMRRLARENPDVVTLLELEEPFEREFSRGKIGCAFFGEAGWCDWLHPNERTHAWIAARIEQSLFP